MTPDDSLDRLLPDAWPHQLSDANSPTPSDWPLRTSIASDGSHFPDFEGLSSSGLFAVTQPFLDESKGSSSADDWLAQSLRIDTHESTSDIPFDTPRKEAAESEAPRSILRARYALPSTPRSVTFSASTTAAAASPPSALFEELDAPTRLQTFAVEPLSPSSQGNVTVFYSPPSTPAAAAAAAAPTTDEDSPGSSKGKAGLLEHRYSNPCLAEQVTAGSSCETVDRPSRIGCLTRREERDTLVELIENLATQLALSKRNEAALILKCQQSEQREERTWTAIRSMEGQGYWAAQEQLETLQRQVEGQKQELDNLRRAAASPSSAVDSMLAPLHSSSAPAEEAVADKGGAETLHSLEEERDAGRAGYGDPLQVKGEVEGRLQAAEAALEATQAEKSSLTAECNQTLESLRSIQQELVEARLCLTVAAEEAQTQRELSLQQTAQMEALKLSSAEVESQLHLDRVEMAGLRQELARSMAAREDLAQQSNRVQEATLACNQCSSSESLQRELAQALRTCSDQVLTIAALRKWKEEAKAEHSIAKIAIASLNDEIALMKRGTYLNPRRRPLAAEGEVTVERRSTVARSTARNKGRVQLFHDASQSLVSLDATPSRPPLVEGTIFDARHNSGVRFAKALASA